MMGPLGGVKGFAVRSLRDFLDKHRDEAKTAWKRRQALMKSGIDKGSRFCRGGKALERAIDEKSEKAFAEYMTALVYKSFVMKRRGYEVHHFRIAGGKAYVTA